MRIRRITWPPGHLSRPARRARRARMGPSKNQSPWTSAAMPNGSWIGTGRRQGLRLTSHFQRSQSHRAKAKSGLLSKPAKLYQPGRSSLPAKPRLPPSRSLSWFRTRQLSPKSPGATPHRFRGILRGVFLIHKRRRILKNHCAPISLWIRRAGRCRPIQIRTRARCRVLCPKAPVCTTRTGASPKPRWSRPRPTPVSSLNRKSSMATMSRRRMRESARYRWRRPVSRKNRSQL